MLLRQAGAAGGPGTPRLERGEAEPASRHGAPAWDPPRTGHRRRARFRAAPAGRPPPAPSAPPPRSPSPGGRRAQEDPCHPACTRTSGRSSNTWHYPTAYQLRGGGAMRLLQGPCSGSLLSAPAGKKVLFSRGWTLPRGDLPSAGSLASPPEQNPPSEQSEIVICAREPTPGFVQPGKKKKKEKEKTPEDTPAPPVSLQRLLRLLSPSSLNKDSSYISLRISKEKRDRKATCERERFFRPAET